MPKSVLSIEELIAIIKHSSLPTLLTEGKNDLILLRRLESEFADVGLSVLPTGGREAVLAIYTLRNTISTRKQLVFLADLDTWVHSGVPTQLLDQSVCFTDGYSIENDLYRDGNLERLMLPQEKLNFKIELSRFLDWYALALSRHLSNKSVEIALHPNTLFGEEGHYRSLCELKDAEAYPHELRDELIGNYSRLIRGKSLLGLLLRQLSSSSRTPKYSAASLLEIGATAGGQHAARIKDWLSVHLK